MTEPLRPSVPLTLHHEPRVWIGCLQCYNAGQLVGGWYPANEAGDVTPTLLHGRPIRPETHEELWCLDLEGFPEAKEMDPVEAQRWGDLYDEVGDERWPAFCAWVRSSDYVEDGEGMPGAGEFEERYCGAWDSFQGFAESLADDIGLLSEVPAPLQPYVDMRAWPRDLAYDYIVEPCETGGVYIFRSL